MWGGVVVECIYISSYIYRWLFRSSTAVYSFVRMYVRIQLQLQLQLRLQLQWFFGGKKKKSERKEEKKKKNSPPLPPHPPPRIILERTGQDRARQGMKEEEKGSQQHAHYKYPAHSVYRYRKATTHPHSTPPNTQRLFIYIYITPFTPRACASPSTLETPFRSPGPARRTR